jgi:hypothetical protein
MTVTYKTKGVLDHPVSSVNDARAFLREHGSGVHQYIYPEPAKEGVHSVTWDLLSDHEWEVMLIADHPLGPQQLNLLSTWISGQNSDGLGEGFEQQPFAEIELDEEDDWAMASFDWQTNPCILEQVL